MQVLCPVQVGREAEAAALAAAVESVRRSGAGQAIVVAGEAGLGKSRLVDEFQRGAAAKGLARLVGECTAGATVPYGPFVGALRRRTRRLDRDALLALFDGPALLAATLLPEVASVVGVPADNQWATEDVFAALWHVLSRLAGDAGAILLLEDLHWADADTLRLIGYVVRELADLPLLLVGTYRPDELHRRHPLQALLAELTRERRLSEVRLKPLDREQARLLLSELFDATEVGDEFLGALHERTGGNPFFLEELAKGLVDRGDVYHDGSDWVRRNLNLMEIPETVRETVLGRCADLPEHALEALKFAAVAGDRLDAAVLRRACGLDDDTLDDVLSAALQLQLLVQRDDGARASYTFRHALTREVFADELVGPDRRRAHLKIADAVIAEYGDDDEYAAELADHLGRSGQATRAVPYALAAARRAAKAHALDEAAERYEHALSLMSPDDDARLEVLLEAAKATFDPQDRRRALAFAGEARTLAQQRNDPVREARALEAFERDLWHRGEHDDEVALLRRMLALVAGRDEREEAWQLRMLSRVLVLQDSADEAIPLIERGIELATRTGHLAALSGLHGTRALRLPVGSPEWQEAVDASLAYARESDGELSLVPILTNVGFMLTWTGMLGSARHRLEEAVALATRTRPTDLYTAACLAWVLALMADYERAVTLAMPVMAGSDEPARIVAGCALAETEYRRGGNGAIVEELHAAAVATGSTQRLVPALAEAARRALGESVETARPLFEQALATTNGGHWLFSPDAAAALAAVGDRSWLTTWVDSIRALTGAAPAGEASASRKADPNPHNIAAMHLCEGHLAALRTEFVEARRLFEQAAEEYAAMPCPARVVEALLGLADAEWAAGDVSASRSAAERAESVAEGVGAHTLVARAKDAVVRASSKPVLATVMFTDLVGSTQRAVASGDTAWRATLERHHVIVRRELARFGGREIDTAGDGFLAAFDSPAQAIRCAAAIRSALVQLDLVVRVGIHTGECQVSGDKLTGLAVHIAARVSAAAQGGEVLVSRTVRDLVAGSGLDFADRGSHVLKGVPGDWQLFALGT